MRIRTRRKILTLSGILILVSMIMGSYAGTTPPGPGLANSPGTYNDPNGSLRQIQPLPFLPFTGVDNAQNHTITFNVLGAEGQQPPTGVVFTVTTTGALTINFIGSQPIVTCICTKTYGGTTETVSYTGARTDTLTVIWTASLITLTESQKVLFRDDFLYTNPLIESSWTIDQYTNPGANAGEYTSSGYLIMKSNAIQIDSVHVTSQIYSPSDYSTGTSVKRKMTLAMIPFAKTETPQTASLQAGFSPLMDASAGAFPGTTPANTPFLDLSTNCVPSGNPSNAIGTSYMAFDNAGLVLVDTCGDGGFNRINLESGMNPSSYTVFTIETYGIFCSTCTDNVYAGTAWVWFRVYQEDSSGRIIQSTDKNLNITSNIAPLFQASYAVVAQRNNNAGATGQVSKIDFVQVQNYGSPVCLVAPAGFLCSRLPAVPSGIIWNNGLVGLIAWLANQIGFGDEQAGAIILFIAMFFGAAFVPYFFSKNVPVGAFGAMLTLGFFTYVGFLPIWTLILVFMGGASIAVLLVLRILSGSSIGSAGGGGE